MRSNLRWCSDVFEITCWNGDIARIVFVIDAHDREVLAWHAAAGTGISGSMGTRSDAGGGVRGFNTRRHERPALDYPRDRLPLRVIEPGRLAW